jgi:hypothetical protein
MNGMVVITNELCTIRKQVDEGKPGEGALQGNEGEPNVLNGS